jgi:hypothetical protein
VKHLSFSEQRAGTTPAEWLPVGSSIGRFVNSWAGRDDLVVFVGEGAGGGFAAAYNPILAEVDVNVESAFGKATKPEMVGDFTERDTQYDYPKATGSIIHEAFHARYSRYLLADAAEALTPDEHHALILLEEGRIEAIGVKESPRSLVFLRASAMELIIHDAIEGLEKHGLNVETAAKLVALVSGRIEANILKESEVESLVTPVREFLGDAVMDALVGILRKAQAHYDHANPLPLYTLAREWASIIRETQEEKGEEPSERGDGSGSGSGSGSEGEMGEMLEALLEALEAATEEMEDKSFGELSEQERTEDWSEQVKKRSDASKRREQSAKEAKDVFGRGTGPVADSRTSSTLKETRQPSSKERIAAVTVGNLLERAKYRDRSETEIRSVLPPGRLRTRAMVQGAAMRSRGIQSTVEPWRRTVRKQTDDPTLNVGILVDISGSMGSAMEPMATTAWVLSEAVRRVQGRAAMVYFGTGVFATLKAGEHLKQVNVYTAPDGTERFDQAFRALDGSLNLIDGEGARLLVVVSDGYYVGDESRKAQQHIAECARNGVGVLWMPFTRHATYANNIVGNNGKVLDGEFDPADAASLIGRAAAEALTRAGRAV